MGDFQSEQWSVIAQEFSSRIRDEKKNILAPACLALLLKLLAGKREKMTALDFGGGDGLLLSHILPYVNLRWNHYDPSAEQSRLARTRSGLSDVIFHDNLDGKVFDIIMCNHVVNVIETLSELTAFFETLYRLTSPGGMVLLTVNHPEYITQPHKYYSYQNISLHHRDGMVIPVSLHDDPGTPPFIFSDVYWTADTLFYMIRHSGFSCDENYGVTVLGWEYPSYLQFILRKSSYEQELY